MFLFRYAPDFPGYFEILYHPYCNVEESQNLLEIHLQADPSNKAALNTDPGDLNLTRVAEKAANYDGKEN